MRVVHSLEFLYIVSTERIGDSGGKAMRGSASAGSVHQREAVAEAEEGTYDSLISAVKVGVGDELLDGCKGGGRW